MKLVGVEDEQIVECLRRDIGDARTTRDKRNLSEEVSASQLNCLVLERHVDGSTGNELSRIANVVPSNYELSRHGQSGFEQARDLDDPARVEAVKEGHACHKLRRLNVEV